jgi:hypothetical protein
MNDDEPFLPILGGFFVFGGLGALGYQTYWWMKEGIWHSLPLSVVWVWGFGSLPSIPNWRGLEKIVFWILSFPISGSLIIVGTLIFFLGVAVDVHRKRR